MKADSFEAAVHHLRAARRVVVFSGAGLSAECGIPTFRDAGGVWRDFAPEQFASWSGILKSAVSQPGRLAEFLLGVIEPIARASPGPGHRAVAALQDHVKTSVITQNIDELHQEAGSTSVHEIHGTLFDVIGSDGRFLRRVSRADLLRIAERLRRARRGPARLARILLAVRPIAGIGVGGSYRPAVTLFGEALPQLAWSQAEADAAACDVMLIVGTSGLVYPAAGLPLAARQHHAQLIAIDPNESGTAEIWLRGDAGDVLPNLVRTAFGIAEK